MPVFQPSFSNCALIVLLACAVVGGCGGAAMAQGAGPSQQKPLEAMPDGDRLARLVKKITDDGLLNDPARLAAALGMEMNFETRAGQTHEKSCEEGGPKKSVTITKATVKESWYRAGPEGMPAMKVPRFMSAEVHVADSPSVQYELYRITRCKAVPDEMEAILHFADVSAYSCFTPERLRRLIGTDYDSYNHGGSGSNYRATPTDEYGARLEFGFQAGAPCATGITIRQSTRDSARNMRGFIKWRTCYDKARLDYCTANPGTGSVHEDRVDNHGKSICGDNWMDYVDREPFSGEKAPPYEVVRDPCGTGR
ncbi:MAG: hypothetical protein K9G48_15355 [Reyranella sp.]|nr:hypothetical protein [Reyranella sp.]